MTPAQELRAAASKIRDAKHWATPGPWCAYTDEVGTDWHPDSAEYRELNRDIDVARDTGPGNAEHIALWHPGVADIVADWLEEESGAAEYRAARGIPYDAEDPPAALRLARALLGGAR